LEALAHWMTGIAAKSNRKGEKDTVGLYEGLGNR
jgi:hypothetical protein